MLVRLVMKRQKIVPLHNESYEHRVFNIVVGHLGRPYLTHTAPMPALTGSVHAHILTKPSRAGFAVISLELIEAGAATCVYRHVGAVF